MISNPQSGNIRQHKAKQHRTFTTIKQFYLLAQSWCIMLLLNCWLGIENKFFKRAHGVSRRCLSYQSKTTEICLVITIPWMWQSNSLGQKPHIKPGWTSWPSVFCRIPHQLMHDSVNRMSYSVTYASNISGFYKDLQWDLTRIFEVWEKSWNSMTVTGKQTREILYVVLRRRQSWTSPQTLEMRQIYIWFPNKSYTTIDSQDILVRTPWYP